MKQPGSFAIIFNQQHALLIIQRRDVPVWTLPGGGIDAGETPEEAVVREVWEETGLKVRVLRKVAVYSPLNRLGALTHTYECTVIGGQLTESEESNGLCFCPLNALPSSFFFVHREWVEDAAKQLPDVIEQPLTSVTYTNLIKYLLKHPLIGLRFLLRRLFSFWHR